MPPKLDEPLDSQVPDPAPEVGEAPDEAGRPRRSPASPRRRRAIRPSTRRSPRPTPRSAPELTPVMAEPEPVAGDAPELEPEPEPEPEPHDADAAEGAIMPQEADAPEAGRRERGRPR